MSNFTYLWLVLMIIFLAAEFATVGLISIWMAGGALITMFISLTGIAFKWQLVIFVLSSFVLLILTRPFVKKYVNNKHEKTNSDKIIGKEVIVTETIDNNAQSGKAIYEGMIWTARSKDSSKIYKKDDIVVVTAIEGVKLIVSDKEGVV